jgi:hypothetical protein
MAVLLLAAAIVAAHRLGERSAPAAVTAAPAGLRSEPA